MVNQLSRLMSPAIHATQEAMAGAMGMPRPFQVRAVSDSIALVSIPEPSNCPMTPLSAKLLLRALTENIARYEAAYGEIHVPVNSTLADNLFRPFQQPPDPPKE